MGEAKRSKSEGKAKFRAGRLIVTDGRGNPVMLELEPGGHVYSRKLSVARTRGKDPKLIEQVHAAARKREAEDSGLVIPEGAGKIILP